MEEEIIGNRWKELDYDGYYLSRLLPPFIRVSSLFFPLPFRSARLSLGSSFSRYARVTPFLTPSVPNEASGRGRVRMERDGEENDK